MSIRNDRVRKQPPTVASATPPQTLVALLQTVIDLQTQEAICVLDRWLRFVAVNEAWKATMRRGDEVIGRTNEDVFGRQDERTTREVDAMFQAVLAGDTVIRPLGAHAVEQISRVVLTPWRDETGAVAGVISRHQATKRGRKGLQARERRLSLAMETAKTFAFEVDFRTGLLVHEPSKQPIQRRDMTSFEAVLSTLPEAWHEVFRAKWTRHLETGDPLRQEYQVEDQHGQLKWRLALAEAVYSVGNELVGLVGVSQDIDDRKQAELALVAEKEAAQAADRAKSEFLANISHEIRTPLNGVLGLASVLAKTDLNASQHEMVRTIEASARTLNTLMSDVLDLAKVESGRLELDVQPFAPAEAVEHVQRLFAAAAAEKGLTLLCQVDPGVSGMAVGDLPRLNQILANLTSNAIKFTAAGHVSLNLRVEGDGDDQRLVFTIADTGIGIAPTALPRLFERFVQADGSISRSFGGTGLGLAISQRLARLMEGEITATSAPGQGSVFTLTVPAPRWAPAIEPAVGAQGEAEPRLWLDHPPRVLLVEDHPVNRQVVEAILGDFVCLECAENGALGLAAFRAQPFDVVLMDMQMPVMDGLEATRAIRAYERSAGTARTPIVMLSANALSEHVRAGLEAGADCFLPKPVAADELICAVAAAANPNRDDQDGQAAAVHESFG